MTTQLSDAPATPRIQIVQNPIRSIIGASSGNLVEWFDFYVYAFTSLYFSSAFFPGDNPTAQLMKSSGVYALGFFARPLGSWIFGRIADRAGRRHSMVIAVLLMSFGSLMVACLPTYANIGVAAPVLLTVARIIQGISVGGEYGTTAAYMSEVARPGRRGFYASFQYVTIIGGQLLATVVLSVLQLMLTQQELKAWGWRVPFVIGAIAAVVALYVRRSLVETTSAEVRAHEDAGTMRGILLHPRALTGVSFYSAISGIVKAEMFPVQIRGLAVGLPYAISNSLFGGTAEYVALWFKNRGTEPSFYWYVTAVAVVGFVATLLMPDNRVHGYLRDDSGDLVR